MPDFTKILNLLNPEKSAGKTLMVLNALGIGFAAASNTFAAATDKNTSAEDKKFLVPAGGVTGLANLAIYAGMTNRLVDKLENLEEGGFAKKVITTMENNDTFEKNAGAFVDSLIKKESKKIEKLNISEKLKESYKENLNVTFKNRGDNSLTDYAKEFYKKDISKGLGVVGAFIGAVVGCAIITPILRDVSAYVVQKAREKKNPALKEKPYRPYFDISHIRAGKYPYGNYNNKPDNRPLSMTSYMAFTHGRTKI